MAREPELIPPLEPGEILLIQRTVNGQNILMVVTIDDHKLVIPDSFKIFGRLDTWGVSSYADGRVQRQAESIDRLLAHLQAHCLWDAAECDAVAAQNQECSLPQDHDTHVWYKRVPTGEPGTVPGTQKITETEMHCPGRSTMSQRPHSRACGIAKHDHGPQCSRNCPTCGGRKISTLEGSGL